MVDAAFLKSGWQAQCHLHTVIIEADSRQANRGAKRPVVDIPAGGQWSGRYQLDVVFWVTLKEGHSGQRFVPRLTGTNDVGPCSVTTDHDQESQRYENDATRHSSCSRC